MSDTDLKEKATDLWTQLLQALREDGLIAMCVTQSGPKTTSVIVNTAAATMAAAPQPWVPMHMQPKPGREVVARHRSSGNHHVLRYCDDGDVAPGWYKGRVMVMPERYAAWTFVSENQA